MTELLFIEKPTRFQKRNTPSPHPKPHIHKTFIISEIGLLKGYEQIVENFIEISE